VLDGIGSANERPVDEPHAWTVTVKEIEENDWNLSAGRYKPFSMVATEHEPPAKLIRELQQMEAEIQQGLEILLVLVENEE
jgi:type I restriction enzyme M protein